MITFEIADDCFNAGSNVASLGQYFGDLCREWFGYRSPLQVVETSGGQLSGRYEQQKLIPGSKIEELNASVSGTSDGQTVVLQVRPTEVLASAYVLSGTISGTTLQ
jgi:hypothetical protein